MSAAQTLWPPDSMQVARGILRVMSRCKGVNPSFEVTQYFETMDSGTIQRGRVTEPHLTTLRYWRLGHPETTPGNLLILPYLPGRRNLAANPPCHIGQVPGGCATCASGS